MDDRAMSTIVGSVLLAFATVAYSVMAVAVVSDVGTVSPSELRFTSIKASESDGRLYVRIIAGDPIPASDGHFLLDVGNGVERHPLADIIEGEMWTQTQPICIIGPGCLAESGSPDNGGYVDIRLVSGNQFLSASGSVLKAFFINDQGGVDVQCAGDVVARVLGTDITQGAGGPTIPVTVQFTSDGGQTHADMNDGQPVSGGEFMVTATQVGDELGFIGTAALNSFWSQYASYDDDPHVLVLRDGDAVPEIQPFGGQTALSSYLDPYVEDGHITLPADQVIVLYEFTSDLSSAAADYQDLVLLLDFPSANC